MVAENETRTLRSNPLRVRVGRIGTRAVKVVERAAGGGAWTEDAVMRAAEWLDAGAKEGGLQRPWPTLAARLRNLVATKAPKKATTTETSQLRATDPRKNESTASPTDKVDATPPVDPAALPFSEFCEKYLKHLEKEGKSRGTVFSYSLDLNVAARHFGETRDVKTITVEDVAAYFESDAVTKNRGGGPKNAITVAKLRRTLRMALEWGAKSGWLWAAPIPATAKTKTTANATGTADASDAAEAAREIEAAPSIDKSKRARPAKKDAATGAPAAPSAT